MLEKFSNILADAYRNHYGVGAFNCLSLENLLGAMEAAEELRSPIILQLAEVQFPYAPPQLMIPAMLECARRATVPVCVHLDHGQSFSTCAMAIGLGCNSVMIDGSSLPFEENVAVTRDVVRMSESFGVDVEAELGHVGDAGIDEGKQDKFTDVEQSAEFIRLTGIQALAVAIGNKHGKYVATPKLNIQRLKELRDRNSLPMVLHGGSGTSDEDFKACVHNGIAKVNVATAIQLGVTARVREYMNDDKANYIDMKYVIKDASKEVVKHHMLLFESNGRCS